MTRTSFIWLNLLIQKDLKVFLMDHRMDIFVPVFVWPEPLASKDINPNLMFYDIRVTKKLLIRNRKNCENKVDYRYSG